MALELVPDGTVQTIQHECYGRAKETEKQS